jgi:hypothetical protein
MRLTSEQWQWHQDFSTYHHDDGVPAPLARDVTPIKSLADDCLLEKTLEIVR